MRPERLQIMLNPDELKAIDDFRFRLRMPSWAAAVRKLLKRALAAIGFEAVPAGTKPHDFGGHRPGWQRVARAARVPGAAVDCVPLPRRRIFSAPFVSQPAVCGFSAFQPVQIAADLCRDAREMQVILRQTCQVLQCGDIAQRESTLNERD